jgi:release factor glutamine methyltransferase
VSGLSAVREVERELAAAGVPDPRTDAELLVSHVLAVPRSAVPLAELREEDAARLRALVERRARREPLQHVLGEWGFRRLTLRVDARALVPRPETEIVVERCLALLRHVAEPHVVDVGTGSGAIALALADEHRGARVVGVDASPAAVALARENAEATRLAGRVTFLHGELLSGLRGPFDLVVSNPPYVSEAELPFLQPEVRDHEPLEALLDAGQTPAIARAAFGLLRPGGALVLEVAAGEAARVGTLLSGLGYSGVAATRDLAGVERVVEGVVPA